VRIQKKINDLFQMISLFTLVFLLSCFIFQSAAAQTTITVSPSDPQISPGNDFSIDVIVETDQTFVGSQMKIKYDNSLVNAKEIEEGDLFSKSGGSYIFNTGTIDNSLGTVTDIFAVTLGTGGIDNDGIFTHIDMTANNISGTCSIHLENVIFSDSEGIPIPVTINNANIEIISSSLEETEITEAGSSGGGGGGGAGNTGENAENIEIVEAKNVYVMSNSQTLYIFEEAANPIANIEYLSLKNAGTISGTIEILKGRSAMVAEDPSGLVYKNVNIWIGKAGYATEKNIYSPAISFKVPKQWIDDNQLSEDSIVLKRYNSHKWNSLATVKTGEDEEFIFFRSETPGFSPFSIVAESSKDVETSDNMIPEETSLEDNSKEASAENEMDRVRSELDDTSEIQSINEKDKDEKALSQNSAFISCLILLFITYRKKILKEKE